MEEIHALEQGKKEREVMAQNRLLEEMTESPDLDRLRKAQLELLEHKGIEESRTTYAQNKVLDMADKKIEGISRIYRAKRRACTSLGSRD